MKVISQWNYDPKKHSKPERKIPGEKELTVPSQTMSIRQIYEKYRKSGQLQSGIMLPGNDQDMDDHADPQSLLDMQKVSQMDMFDKSELALANAQAIAQSKEKLKAIDKAAAAKKAERQKELAEMEADFKARREAKKASDAKSKPASDEQA